MPKILIAAFGKESLTYVRRSRQMGLHVRILDCVEAHHGQLLRWFGDDILQVNGHRSDVRKRVVEEGFDAAIVHEDDNFVRSALITQSVREAGVQHVMVVTKDPVRHTLYRRCGAHHIVVANSVEQAWMKLSSYLPSFATA
jgi:Trk K+ transport system NAD-binding subunit